MRLLKLAEHLVKHDYYPLTLLSIFYAWDMIRLPQQQPSIIIGSVFLLRKANSEKLGRLPKATQFPSAELGFTPSARGLTLSLSACTQHLEGQGTPVFWNTE